MPGLKSDLAALTHFAGAELEGIFRELDRGAFRGEALYDLLPALIEKYGSAAATITADWYDEMRIKVVTRSQFTAIPAEIRDSGGQALVGWATSQTSDPDVLRQLILGGTNRRILNYSRRTVMGSALADPAADGWQRTGEGSSCAFCLMLIGRGAVYTEATADFASHDHCNCGATVAWRNEPRPVKPFAYSDRRVLADGAIRPISDAERERVNAWIESH